MGRSRTRSLAAAVASVLLLSGCGSLLPMSWPLGGGSIASTDVITLSRGSMYGFTPTGSSSVEIDGTTMVHRFALPARPSEDRVVIYELEHEVTAEDRDRIEELTAEYIDWERTVPEDERDPCTDIPGYTVQVTGSVTHKSSMQDCHGGTPLTALASAIHASAPEKVTYLANPNQAWSIEIAPLEHADGRPVETYTLAPVDNPAGGMEITAENPPEGWGQHWVDGTDPGPHVMDWDLTGEVLTELNLFFTSTDQIHCDHETRVQLTKHTTGDHRPDLTWSYPLCEDQVSGDFVETMRGL